MNTPNKLTVLRIILIPVYMVLYLMCGDFGLYAAFVVFIAAALTDQLDGHLARKYNQITTFGKLMDPIADKMLVMSALICFVERDVPYMTAGVIAVILARDFIVNGIRLVAAGENKIIAASMWGKSKTVSQMILVLWVMVAQIITLHLPEAALVCDTVTLIAVIAAVALTVYSGFDYVWKNKNLITFK